MAMTEILLELSGEVGFTLKAAHLDHGIREESGGEKELVETYCLEKGLNLTAGTADVPAEASRSGTGIEEAAREVRYAFLRKAAAGSGASKVALGHTRNDQAETVIHNVIRGSGLKGLAGMPAARDIFIRPVLCCGREELIRYLEDRVIRYSIDSSNFDNSYMRNRIRNTLLPLLRSDFNPSVDDALIRLGENVSETVKASVPAIEAVMEKAEKKEGFVEIPLSGLAGLSDFEVYLLIDSVLKEEFGVFQDIEKCHFDSAKKLIRSARSGSGLELPHGVRIDLEQTRLRIGSGHRTHGEEEEREKIVMHAEGRYELPGAGITVRIEKIGSAGGRMPFTTDTETYLGSLSFPVTIRRRLPGDRMTPFGMKGTKKLSDIMIDCKVPLHERRDKLVFEDEVGIFWVPGVTAGERTRINGDEKEIIRISIEDRR
jgi:tRNA(Ile)-lysidine synthase